GIEYWILEPSPVRRGWQQKTLAGFSSHVRWFAGLDDLKLKTQNSKLNGVLFSNELLDAFPVRRFGWDANGEKWVEWGVALAVEICVWEKIEAPSRECPSSIRDLPSSLLDVLPDGYSIENSPAAENWWREAAGILERGKWLAIDYGFTADEMFSPARTR